MPRFSSLLTPPSRVRYAVWRLAGARTSFRCQFNVGPKIAIRPAPSEDFNTAYDVFRLGIYDTNLGPLSVRSVVDLGGNVGYTCLLWCWRYPEARVLTFEPNPRHAEILKWHLKVNNYDSRVRVVEAAASNREGAVTFADADVWTRPISADMVQPHPSFQARLVDLFKQAGDQPIDILKMDIEGGEYDIMTDPRFDMLAQRCRMVIMEWHKFNSSQGGGRWCADRLQSLGFNVVEKANPDPKLGLIYAQRGLQD